MKVLARQIKKEITDRGVCAVYESDLDRVWPNKKNREAAIRKFAHSHAWTLAHYKEGFVAVFAKPRPSREQTQV